MSKQIIFSNLAKIAAIKEIVITSEQYLIWTTQIESDLKNNKINDIQKGFDNLLHEKTYGGLDYAVFFEGAKINEDERIEKEWQECLSSAINGGEKEISARSAKALNSFGGMIWLRNSNLDEVNWVKKDFISAWKNMPEPNEIDFNCPGLTAPIYLINNDQKLIGK